MCSNLFLTLSVLGYDGDDDFVLLQRFAECLSTEDERTDRHSYQTLGHGTNDNCEKEQKQSTTKKEKGMAKWVRIRRTNERG